MIACIKSEDGDGYKHIFEVKDVQEILETGVIPIAYHSAYSRGIAQGIIRDAFEEYEDFFKVFLEDYSKIVLDEESKDKNALIIDDYAKDLDKDGYSLEQLVSKVLKDYDLNKNEVANIISRMKEYNNGVFLNDSSIFTRFFMDKTVSTMRLRNYYTRNGKYRELKQLLDRGNNTNGIARDFLENETIPFLNTIFDKDFFPTLISNNPKVVRDAIKNIRMTLENEASQTDGVSTIDIDRIEAINLTRTLVKDIDPTGNLGKYFEDILRDGKLLTFRNDPKTGLPFEFFTTNENDEVVVLNDRNMHEASTFFTIDFSENISDVFELVNRIVLTYIDTYKISDDDKDDFNNMFTSYYETRARDWLINIGKYDAEEINRLFSVRRLKNVVGKDLETIEIIADAMARKLTNKKLSLTNISDSTDVEEQKHDALNVATQVMLSAGELDTGTVSLAIGSYLGDKYSNDDFARCMMWAASAYEYETYCNADILNKLMRCVIEDNEIGIDPSVLWRNDLEEISGADTDIEAFDWDCKNTTRPIQYIKNNKSK